MRVKQRATKSFVSANKPETSQMGPSAHYQQVFNDPAATFRQLRDEEDWYISKNPHRPSNYSPDWRVEMQRASDEASKTDEAEQAGAQIPSGAARHATKGKDQPQHTKGSSAAGPRTKHRLDNLDEEDDAANPRRSKRARSIATPPTALSKKDKPDSDVGEAPSLRRSTPVRISTTLPIVAVSKDTADGEDSEEIVDPGLHRSTRARTSAVSPPPTVSDRGMIKVHQRIKIKVRGHSESTSGSSSSNSYSDNAKTLAAQVPAEPAMQAPIMQAQTMQAPAMKAIVQSVNVPDSVVPAASAKSGKESSGPAKEFNGEQLSWMNEWFNDDDAGNKTYDKGLKWHQQINRDCEKRFDLKVPLKEYSLRNKRQEMRECGQVDGTVRTKEFYEKPENYPRKRQTKSQQAKNQQTAAQAPATPSAACNANAPTTAQEDQEYQATTESSRKRKHDDEATTVDGPGEVGEDEDVAAESSQNP